MVGEAKIGIISGSGPDAGLNVLKKVLEEHRRSTEYNSDKDAPYAVLIQEPDIGGPHGKWDLEDRETSEFKRLWNGLTTTIKKLDKPNSDCFCLSCNTLHVLEPDIRDFMSRHSIKSEFISIIQSTTREIQSLVQETKKTPQETVKVAVFGTLLTTDLDAKRGKSPYKALCEMLSGPAAVFEFAKISQPVRDRMQQLIIDVKVRGGEDLLLQKECIEILHNLINDCDADVIVLACTEIPLLLNNEYAAKQLQEFEDEILGMIDTNIGLARALLQFDLK